MSHAEFIEAYRSGAVRVHVDPKAAAGYVSGRLLLPLVMLPILGIGVALALTGWLWIGFALIGLATVAPILIKRSASHFVLTQALEDERFYAEALDSRVIVIRAG